MLSEARRSGNAPRTRSKLPAKPRAKKQLQAKPEAAPSDVDAQQAALREELKALLQRIAEEEATCDKRDTLLEHQRRRWCRTIKSVLRKFGEGIILTGKDTSEVIKETKFAIARVLPYAEYVSTNKPKFLTLDLG